METDVHSYRGYVIANGEEYYPGTDPPEYHRPRSNGVKDGYTALQIEHNNNNNSQIIFTKEKHKTILGK